MLPSSLQGDSLRMVQDSQGQFESMIVVEGRNKHRHRQKEEGFHGEHSCKLEDQKDLLQGEESQENIPGECLCSGTNLQERQKLFDLQLLVDLLRKPQGPGCTLVLNSCSISNSFIGVDRPVKLLPIE